MPIPTHELIRRFSGPGPDYTSYPAADRFVEAFTAEQLAQALAQRRNGTAAMRLPLSLGVHIPFGELLCCCGTCHKVVTKHPAGGETYLRYLGRELGLYTGHLGTMEVASQLDFGGASTTLLNDSELRQWMAMLRRSFRFAPGGNYSIDVDPCAVDSVRLATLAELGFNQLKFALQDSRPAVQKAAHHIEPAEQAFSLVEAARRADFESIGIDLIYGVPQQTPESFDRTLAQALQLRPDRVALHAHDQLPQRLKPQRRMDAAELPGVSARLSMLRLAFSAFQKAGYTHIGMGQFALPADALAVAKRQGRLHRNLQGYSTQPDCDVISLGVSAIGKIGATYSQNSRTLEGYCDCLDQGRLPVAHGLALSRDDMVRRSIIMALMCQGQLEFESIELAYLVDFKHCFAAELELLGALEKQGLAEVSDTGIQVTAMGCYFVRDVAMIFDRYLQADRRRARFSRII